MITVEELNWLFWYTRNTTMKQFVKDVFGIENIYDEPGHRQSYMEHKFRQFTEFNISLFDTDKQQAIIDAAYAKYGGEEE
tara:strand:+ start:2662 stop:2901 length:240 start_codon:yes stop_codon:yes gene_type:complete